MKKYILAIDQGTTSTRAILFNRDGEAKYQSIRPVKCYYPHNGWVEQDPLELFISCLDCVNELLVKADCNEKDIDSIGITNQRETTIVWDKKTGKPIYPAIVWQSRQTQEICAKLEQKRDFIHEKTGLIINPYFSASKIRFILDNVEGAQEKAEKGELLFGTVDSWLIYKVTEGKVHATDVTNASRTLLFNIHTMSWDKDLCKLFNIPMKMLPEVKPSSSLFGHVAKGKTPICGVAGDQQAALFGHCAFEKGERKATYGTGCFMLLNTGNKPVLSKNGLLTTVAWQIGNKVTYALEGSVFMGGALIQWLRDGLEFFNEAKDSEKLANKVESSNGVYIVPAFVGLGTPYWDDDARGTILGLTRDTNKNHIARAALEAICYQCKDVMEVMKSESGISLKTLCVDGGATANKYLLQFESDILQTDIKLPKVLETTSLGVCYLSGLYTGFFKDLETIKKSTNYQAIYKPKMDKKKVDELYAKWKKAVEATRVFK